MGRVANMSHVGISHLEKVILQNDENVGADTAGTVSRISTKSRAGAAQNVPALGYGYGEAIELRYDCKYTASQFQAMFIRVAAASGVANTSTLRGMEVDARNASNQNAGTLEGVFGTVSVKGTGTITGAYAVSANLSMDADVAATITEGAGVRSKIQVEDAATLTAMYGVLVEHEAVTGGKAVTAAYGAKSGAGEAFTSLIDASGATLVETESGTDVVLIKFKGANGTTYYVVHDTDAATVLAVATSL